MDLLTIVRPEHMNHYGNLFGGQMLKWIDEYAYLVAVRDFPGARLVTRAMADVSFTRGVKCGSTLRFEVRRGAVGTTSVRYSVRVFAQECGEIEEYHVFETTITFVCVDRNQQKTALPPAADA
ncbi:MAG: acyl-CoA thioesterase [Lentisphaerae bacterium]|nr:acyl-CoA thioesterase [Lentisphaerota bacterium]